MKKPGETTERIINKEFTDRDKARKLFWEWYKKSSENMDDFFVLSYYGIGGIGKSSLVNKLCRELHEQNGFYIKYDFEYASHSDAYSVLVGVKQSIRNKYSTYFHFPLFNTALVFLAKKSDIKFENDEIVKNAVAESPHFQNALSVLSLAPVVGGYIQNTIAIMSQFYTDIDNLAVSVKLKKKYKEVIEKMGTLEADELRENMPQYFWIDMTENMRKLPKPLVIFLDTYESYINTFKAISNVVLDSWLREGYRSVIQQIPGVLWVIAGREKLYWNFNDEWDPEHLECYDIRDFTDLDSTIYLNKAGITDDGLVSHICEITRGVPIYLDLCVDTYYLLMDRGVTPTIKNFDVDRNNRNKLANRYTKYLDSADCDLIYMLASMGTWKDDEAEWVGTNIHTSSYSAERYNSIIGHSFITNEGSKRAMHNIMVDALLPEIADSTKNKYNGELFHYRINRLEKGLSSHTDTMAAVNDAKDAFCRITGENIYPGQYEDFRKLTEKISEVRKKGFIHDALSICSKLNEHCEEPFGDTDYYGESLKSLGDALYSMGKYEAALEYHQSSYDIRSRILNEDHPDTLRSLHCIGADYSKMGKYMKSFKVDEQVYEARKRLLGEDHPATLRSLQNIGVDIGNLGAYIKAHEVNQQVYDARKRILGEEHPDTLSSLHNIGVDYSFMREYKKAIEVKRQVYDARKRLIGEDHPDTLISLYSIGVDYEDMGEYEKSKEVEQQVWKYTHEKAFEVRKHQYEKAFAVDRQEWAARKHQYEKTFEAD